MKIKRNKTELICKIKFNLKGIQTMKHRQKRTHDHAN